jgi:hypothetical protein
MTFFYEVGTAVLMVILQQGDVLLIDWHRGEEGLVSLRDTQKRSSGPKVDFPVPDAAQLMTAEARA